MYICIYICTCRYIYIYIYKHLLKLAQTRTDMYFLSCCNKLHLVPSGLRLKNPFRHHPDNYVSQAIIDKACAKLSNIALHKAYAIQKRLSTLLKVPCYISMKLSVDQLIRLKRLNFSMNYSTRNPPIVVQQKH